MNSVKEALLAMLEIADRHFWVICGIIAFFFGMMEFAVINFAFAIYLKLDEILDAMYGDDETTEKQEANHVGN